jgi:predicted short-subunit dehydrogenase-like oxidoreductase (DUF2520 family)
MQIKNDVTHHKGERLKKLNIIGCGKVGQTLAHLWRSTGTFEIQDVLTTSLPSAQRACTLIGGGNPVSSLAVMRPADVWMIGVQDAQIEATASTMAQALGSSGSAIETAACVVFHCSGALSSNALDPLAGLGWQTASAHCILSFSSVDTAITQFSGTACALEGNSTAIACLRPSFERIGAQCFGVDSDQKLLYHAAAVFATNFLPVLQKLAEDAWRASGVPKALLPSLRTALLNNAVANILRTGPEGALTGPAARGDTAAIARQSAAVNAWDAQAGAAYDALSALALRMANASKETTATAATPH